MDACRKSSDPDGYPGKFRDSVHEASADCKTAADGGTMSDSDLRTVGECFWQSYKKETGITEIQLSRLITDKLIPNGIIDSNTKVSYGSFDPIKLLEFAKSHRHQFELSAAIAELKRRINDFHHIAIRGADLVKVTSEADLETGIRSKKPEGRITESETQRQLLRLKQLMISFVTGSNGDEIPWTDVEVLRSFQENLLSYISILEEYKESINYRNQFEHGVHDYVENKRHDILRSKEAAARSLIRPSAILSSIQNLCFQNCGINLLDEQLASMFPNLISLSVSGNRLGTLQNLPSSVYAMHACGCGIETIELTGLPASMIHLGVAYNKISNISILGETETQLVSLDLGNNLLCSLDDLQVLDGIRTLTKLVLCGNPLSLLPDYRKSVVQRFTRLTSLDDVLVTPEERTLPIQNDDTPDNTPEEETTTEPETEGTFTITFTIEEVKGLPLPEDFERSDDVSDPKAKGKPPPPKPKAGKGKQEEEEAAPSRVIYIRGCTQFPQQETPFTTKEVDLSTQVVDEAAKTAQLAMQSSTTFTFRPTLEVGLWLRSLVSLELREAELKPSDKGTESDAPTTPVDNLLGMAYLDLTQLTRSSDEGGLPGSFSVALPVAVNENIAYRKKRKIISSLTFDAAVVAVFCILPVTSVCMSLSSSNSTTPVKQSAKQSGEVSNKFMNEEPASASTNIFISLRVSLNAGD